MHPQVQAAIDAVNAGDKPRAFELINQLLAQDSCNVEGWLMLAALTEDEERKVNYLQYVLSIDPKNQIAREELVGMKRAAPLPPARLQQPAPLTQTRLPLVQAALVALKEGNKPRALEYLKQRISEDPKDAEPWVIMTQLVDDSVRQRQYLQHALKLNPNHQGARALLVVLERAAPGSTTPNTTTTPTVAPSYVAPTISSAPRPMVSKKNAPQVYKFRYPLGIRIVIYGMALGTLIILVSGAIGQMGLYGLPFVLTALAGAWMVSMRVEIDASGVRFVQFFIRKAMKWDDITSLRTGVQRYHLQLIGSSGKLLKINSQVEGYETILKIVRQRRPDLFSDMTGTDKTFNDYLVFRKSIVKYVSVPFGLILVGLGLPVFWSTQWQDALGFLALMLFGLYLITAPLLGVRHIKVEPQLLTLDWIFRKEEYHPHHIKSLRLETLRTRYGSVHHYVVIQPREEKAIQLTDFGGDTDMLYGVLMNWWKSAAK